MQEKAQRGQLEAGETSFRLILTGGYPGAPGAESGVLTGHSDPESAR